MNALADASRRHKRPPESANPAMIRAGDVYPVEYLKNRLRIGEQKLREYERRGLRVRGEGKTFFVLGEEFLEFVKETLPVRSEAVSNN